MLLALCAYLSDGAADEGQLPRFLGGLIIVGVPAVMLIIQPDLGSASVLIAMAMGVLLVAGAKARYILTISLLSLATVGAAFVGGLVNEYQLASGCGCSSTRTTRRSRAGGVPGQQRRAGGRHRRLFGKGWLQGPLTNGATSR